eukprot:scaffold8762_cov114-Isochrysis_galbana.AAC.6
MSSGKPSKSSASEVAMSSGDLSGDGRTRTMWDPCTCRTGPPSVGSTSSRRTAVLSKLSLSSADTSHT